MAEKRILLVEEERELRELLVLGLRRAGYTVDGAATAAEAQQLLDAQSYALVIADWHLPDGNGIDLADQAVKLRARTQHCQRLFVRVTGRGGTAPRYDNKAD